MRRFRRSAEWRLFGAFFSAAPRLSIVWWALVVLRGPLLCVLDEPTAALDTETEHALFERFAFASRAASDDGRITVLVSHRFSTARTSSRPVRTTS